MFFKYCYLAIIIVGLLEPEAHKNSVDDQQLTVSFLCSLPLPIAVPMRPPKRFDTDLHENKYRCYAASCLFFAYAEGYKGFQLKFSPLVVKRSFTLVIGTKQGSVLNYLLAPLSSMGLIHATRKRLITSWVVSLGVATLVAIVKHLPSVWRCILDAGVVVGLSYGSLSILFLFLQAWKQGQAPKVDACLPADKPSSSKTL
jgi:hypothetical protein